MNARALHFVFKIGKRAPNVTFFRELLGMKILRHEEFNEGCAAACNGPYDNRWSKTMVGYGPEDNHFVVELTWNIDVSSYARGNDFHGLTIVSQESIARAKALKWPITQVNNGQFLVESPDGYPVYLIDEPQPTDKDPVVKVTLASTDIEKSIAYWNELLQMNILKKDDRSVLLSYGREQASLELKKIDEPIDHAAAYGRIAFSIPADLLKDVEAKIVENGQKVLTPLVSLDTPGKATVTVVILADPDGHEICFVGDEAFRELSQFDPNSNASLDFHIKKHEAYAEKQKADC